MEQAVGSTGLLGNEGKMKLYLSVMTRTKLLQWFIFLRVAEPYL